jgi:hypothetical protein
MSRTRAPLTSIAAISPFTTCTSMGPVVARAVAPTSGTPYRKSWPPATFSSPPSGSVMKREAHALDQHTVEITTPNGHTIRSRAPDPPRPSTRSQWIQIHPGRWILAA